MKIVFGVLILICIFLIMVWARVFFGSMRAYHEGEAYLNDGLYLKAINYFDRSLHWYAPFNLYIEKSAEKLWQISLTAEIDEDIRLAIIAVRTLRRGFIAARSFYVPGKDWIDLCDARLQKLIILQQSGDVGAGGIEVHDDSILDHPQVRGPNVLWSWVMLVGFLGWVGSAIILIISGREEGQKEEGLEFWRIKWITLCVVFWVVWIFGMMKA